LLTGNGAAHEDDEERDGDRENLSGNELAGGRGRRDSRGSRLLPGDREEDDDEEGQHPEEVAPSGSTDGGAEREKVFAIGENSGEEDETKGQRERAKPGGERSPGAEEEGEREKEIPGNVENEDLPEESGLRGLPAGGGVEEIEIGGDGNDRDLDEVEDAEPINADGVLVGTRKEHHEDGSGPDEEQDIGGPGNVRGTRDKTLVVRADGLSEGFESNGESEKKPELACVGGRAARGIPRAGGSKEGQRQVEGIGDQEPGGGGANKLKVEDELQGQKEGGHNGESRKLARGEQSNLTNDDRDRPREVRVGKSLHQSGLGGGRVFSCQFLAKRRGNQWSG